MVLRTARTGAVGLVGGRRHRHETHLSDLHAGINSDRQVGDVRQLEGDVAVESRVDEPGRGMDQEPEAAERALALDAGDEIVGDCDSLERGAEHELPGVQHERLVT